MEGGDDGRYQVRGDVVSGAAIDLRQKRNKEAPLFAAIRLSYFRQFILSTPRLRLGIDRELVPEQVCERVVGACIDMKQGWLGKFSM